MKRLITVLFILTLFVSPAFAALGTYPINYSTVSNPRELDKLLRNRIGGIEDSIGALGGGGGSGGGATGTGNTYYVDSGVGSDTYAGTSWVLAKATLDAAVALCTANNGDKILVAAGHAETLSGADGVDIDVAGVFVEGLGDGNDLPEFTFSATGSEFVIGADNVKVQGLRFIAGVSAITMGISIEAAGDNFTMAYCIFPKPTTNSWEFNDAIDVADGANDILIFGCEYYNDEAGAAPNHFIDAGNGTAGPTRLQVINCVIKGDFAVSAIWSDEPCDEALIYGNKITNHTSAQHCIEFTDTGTGTIAYNMMYTDAEATTLDPGSMYCFENYVTTAIDASAVLIPAADDTAQNFIGVDDNDNAAATSNVAANENGSVLERLEQIQEGVNIGTGASLPANKSLFDIIGETYTDDGGADTADDVASHLNVILEYVADGTGAGAEVGAKLPAGKSLFDIIGETYTDDGGADALDDVASHLNLMSTFFADGDGDFAAGSPLPSNVSLYDVTGAYTADGGADDEDTIMAHLDLIYADSQYIADLSLPAAPVANSLAAFIASGGTALGTELADSTSIVDAIGHTGAAFHTTGVGYWMEKTVSWNETLFASDDAFVVAGGPIMITSLFGVITTAYDGQCDHTWWIDADTAAQDHEFTTSVDIDAYLIGEFLTFSAVNPAVISNLTAGATNGGAGQTMSPWFCPAGTIELLIENNAASAGAITWYMTYKPLASGVTVTAQ